MVRLQVSLELLVYIALSAASLALSLSLFYAYYGRIVNEGISMQFAAFASQINGNVGYAYSSFAALVPAHLCNASISNASIVYDGQRFSLLADVEISRSLCSSEGRIAQVSMQMQQNGTFLVV